jgi:hypothetical protein
MGVIKEDDERQCYCKMLLSVVELPVEMIVKRVIFSLGSPAIDFQI